MGRAMSHFLVLADIGSQVVNCKLKRVFQVVSRRSFGRPHAISRNEPFVTSRSTPVVDCLASCSCDVGAPDRQRGDVQWKASAGALWSGLKK
eukprot:1357763-Amphidinium_carterae.1